MDNSAAVSSPVFSTLDRQLTIVLDEKLYANPKDPYANGCIIVNCKDKNYFEQFKNMCKQHENDYNIKLDIYPMARINNDDTLNQNIDHHVCTIREKDSAHPLTILYNELTTFFRLKDQLKQNSTPDFRPKLIA